MAWKNAKIVRLEKQKNAAGVIVSIFAAMTIEDDSIADENKYIETFITGDDLDGILNKPTPAAYQANILNHLKTVAKAAHKAWTENEIPNRPPPVERLEAAEILADVGVDVII